MPHLPFVDSIGCHGEEQTPCGAFRHKLCGRCSSVRPYLGPGSCIINLAVYLYPVTRIGSTVKIELCKRLRQEIAYPKIVIRYIDRSRCKVENILIASTN